MKPQHQRARVTQRRFAARGVVKRRPLLSSYECLEQRTMMDASGYVAETFTYSPWQNPFTSADVNSDGFVSGFDLITIISELNGDGPRSLITSPRPGFFNLGPINSFASSQSNFITLPDQNVNFLDVDGDLNLSGMDLLLVKEQLNTAQLMPGDVAEVTLVATDLAGNPLSGQILAGTYFRLEAIVTNGDPTHPDGIGAAFIDVTYPVTGNLSTDLVIIDPLVTTFNREVFEVGLLSNNFDIPGLINNGGGSTDVAPTASLPFDTPLQLWSIPVFANNEGTFTFTATPPGGGIPTDWFFFPTTLFPDDIDEDNDVTYGSLPVTISTGTVNLPQATLAGPAAITEGNAGTTTNMVFTVTLNNGTQAVEVPYAVISGTATSGSDFNDNSGTLTFAIGETSKTITVQVRGDNTSEPNENYQVVIANPKNATIANGLAIGTINNDDQPAISISDATVVEGSSGVTNMVFTVSLSAPGNAQSTVVFSTADGAGPVPAPALAGDADYVPVSGTLTFLANDPSSKLITVQINGDNFGEPNEVFQVNLSGPIGATIADGQGLGTILNDDPASIIINDVTVTEGTLGNTTAVFTVSLTAISLQTITVGFATANDTAMAPGDYTARSGILTFNPGVTQLPVTVTVLGDSLDEGNEQFVVNLSSVNPATTSIRDAQGVGTILDDDQPGFRIGDAVVVEGNSGTTSAVFRVSLTSQLTQPTTINFATSAGTAIAGTDYASASGVLTFNPGQTSQLLTVAVNGDTLAESDETFNVTLSSPSSPGVIIVDPTGVGTILDDDTTTTKTMRIRLRPTFDAAGNTPVTGSLAINDVFFVQVLVTDLRPVTAQLPFSQHGVFSAYLDVPINSAVARATGITYGANYTNAMSGDITPDLIDELGAVTNRSTGGGAIANPDVRLATIAFVAIGSGLLDFGSVLDAADDLPRHETTLFPAEIVPATKIEFDPGTPVAVGSNVFGITALNPTVTEGNTGTTTSAVFRVTRTLPDATTATVRFQTQNPATGIIATSGSDYNFTQGTLSFPAGVTQQLITVQVLGDALLEDDETFEVGLFGAVNASIGSSQASTTIVNDDVAPTVLSVSDAVTDEGGSAVFTITLSGPSGKDTVVNFSTANDTTGANPATAGLDYTAINLTPLTFAPLTTQRTVTVSTNGDLIVEPAETFLLNAGGRTGRGTINDLRPSGVTGFVYNDKDRDGIKDANEIAIPNAIVTIRQRSAPFFTATTTTAADGSYSFLGLTPGDYDLTEIQPGFFFDGRDTFPDPSSPTGVSESGTPPSDQFTFTLAPAAFLTDFNFGEGGLRPEIAAVFMSRRALFASAVLNGGQTGGVTDINLQRGDVFLSFDGGWSGTRLIEGLYQSVLGTVNLTLFDTNFNVVAQSTPGANPAQIFYAGTLGQTYFLKVSGTNTDVDLRISETVSIDNVQVTEGDSGTTQAVLTASISRGPVSAAQSQTVTVEFATADNDATAGSDYQAVSGTLTFVPGVESQTLTIAVQGDTTDEVNETFFINLSNATNITIGDVQSVVTITDDDQAPSLLVTDTGVQEGASGTTTDAVFTVMLSAASERTITVHFATGGNTANSADFTGQSGTLTFDPGVTSLTVTVAVKGDNSPEGNESFFLNLSNPSNAFIADGQGICQIIDEVNGFAASSLSDELWGDEDEWLADSLVA